MCLECCLLNRLVFSTSQLFVSFCFPQVVKLKKMKVDEICDLLDSLGFYKRSQKGEDVPEEFKNFPLKAPRDEL